MPHNHSNYKRLAELMDSRFVIPGTKIRFGLDPILGLIPGAGDLLSGMLSLYFVIIGARDGASAFVLIRMLLNILVDIVVGAIPLLGEFFDIGWKANLRNARLLDNFI